MKTNRPVPTEIWDQIETSVEKVIDSEFTRRPGRLNFAVGLAVLIAISFVYVGSFTTDFQKDDVNAYLYELHTELYPNSATDTETIDLIDLI
tara:strand:- start:44 stop:319 length:276 start_codon:yes stop_codon:yes gene_type:complete